MTEARLNELAADCDTQLAEARAQNHRPWVLACLRRREFLNKIAARVAAEVVDAKHGRGRDER
jgi:hypothetical protein